MPSLREALLSAPVAERADLLSRYLREEPARALGTTPDRIAEDAPLSTLGRRWRDPAEPYLFLRGLIQRDLGLVIYPVELAPRFASGPSRSTWQGSLPRSSGS